MARVSALLLIFLFGLICCVPSLEARKLLSMEKREVPSLKDNLILSALPKGPMLPPGLSDNGHAMDERHFTLHLAKIDRILQSAVPSPGVGH